MDARESIPGGEHSPELLSVLIPAFNEESVIGPTVRALSARLEAEPLEYEILVVNDGSVDATENVLITLERIFPRLCHVNNASPRGYGFAVRFGLRHCKGDAVAIVMADGSDSPDDLVRYFTKLREGYDCAFGHRFTGRSRVSGYPRGKAILNRIGNRLIAWLTRHPYTDFTNGFKCFRRQVIEAMQPLVSGKFNLTVEMSMKAVLGGAQIAVVPNDWTARSLGESKFRVFRMGRLYLATITYCLTLHWLLRQQWTD
jgi:dolichol-phosphate mannosyltransferase